MTCGNNCAGCDCKTEPKAATPYESIQTTETDTTVENWIKNALALLMRYRAAVTLGVQVNDGSLEVVIESLEDINSVETQFTSHLLNVPTQETKDLGSPCCGKPDTCTELCVQAMDAIRRRPEAQNKAAAATEVEEPYVLGTLWKPNQSAVVGIPPSLDIEVGMYVSDTSVTSFPNMSSSGNFAEVKALKEFAGTPIDVASTGNNRPT